SNAGSSATSCTGGGAWVHRKEGRQLLIGVRYTGQPGWIHQRQHGLPREVLWIVPGKGRNEAGVVKLPGDGRLLLLLTASSGSPPSIG
ncbi:unnamed protein product, partial [Ectocarpus fasciculatus]